MPFPKTYGVYYMYFMSNVRFVSDNFEFGYTFPEVNNLSNLAMKRLTNFLYKPCTFSLRDMFYLFLHDIFKVKKFNKLK